MTRSKFGLKTACSLGLSNSLAPNCHLERNSLRLVVLLRPLLARIMHKFSTAPTKSSVLTARPASGCPSAWRNALRSALSSLRDKNLCIIRARSGMISGMRCVAPISSTSLGLLRADKTRYIYVSGTQRSLLPRPMPISMMLWSGAGQKPTLIKIASAYEAATKHRVPPPDFGPLP